MAKRLIVNVIVNPADWIGKVGCPRVPGRHVRLEPGGAGHKLQYSPRGQESGPGAQ